jgi:hypothetical protein
MAMTDLADMRARLEQLIATAHGNRVTGAQLGMLLGEISALRREIATIEQRAAKARECLVKEKHSERNSLAASGP